MVLPIFSIAVIMYSVFTIFPGSDGKRVVLPVDVGFASLIWSAGLFTYSASLMMGMVDPEYYNNPVYVMSMIVVPFVILLQNALLKKATPYGPEHSRVLRTRSFWMKLLSRNGF